MAHYFIGFRPGNSFALQVQQLQRVSHPNITAILGRSSNESHNHRFLVMEFADCGSLYTRELHYTKLLRIRVNSGKPTLCDHSFAWTRRATLFLPARYQVYISIRQVLLRKSIHLSTFCSWLLQSAGGVEYLHNMQPKPLMHRDLKPAK